MFLSPSAFHSSLLCSTRSHRLPAVRPIWRSGDHSQCGCEIIETNWPQRSCVGCLLSGQFKPEKKSVSLRWLFFFWGGGVQSRRHSTRARILHRERQTSESVQMLVACLQSFTTCLCIDNVVHPVGEKGHTLRAASLCSTYHQSECFHQTLSGQGQRGGVHTPPRRYAATSRG